MNPRWCIIMAFCPLFMLWFTLCVYIEWVCTQVSHASILWCHAKYFYFLKNLTCSALFPLLQTLATSDVLTPSIVLPFLKSHIVGIIHSEAFLDWYLSPIGMHLRSLHFFSQLSSSFLLNIPLSGYNTVYSPLSTLLYLKMSPKNILFASKCWQL